MTGSIEIQQYRNCTILKQDLGIEFIHPGVSPQDLHIKCLIPSLTLVGDGRNFKRWNLVGGLRSLKECPWKGMWTPIPSCLSPLTPCLPYVQQLHQHASALYMKYCSPLAQVQCRSFSNGLNETTKTISQNKTFLLLSWFPQVFCYSNRKLTNNTEVACVCVCTIIFLLVYINCTNRYQYDFLCNHLMYFDHIHPPSCCWKDVRPAKTRLKPRWLEERKIYYSSRPAPWIFVSFPCLDPL
jgi:hypothetical protein